MSIEQMKEKIKAAYPNINWSMRVDKMPDNQVIAIYNKMKERHQLDTPKQKLRSGKNHGQMSIYDFV